MWIVVFQNDIVDTRTYYEYNIMIHRIYSRHVRQSRDCETNGHVFIIT